VIWKRQRLPIMDGGRAKEGGYLKLHQAEEKEMLALAL
jgi:hypothetical protein